MTSGSSRALRPHSVHSWKAASRCRDVGRSWPFYFQKYARMGKRKAATHRPKSEPARNRGDNASISIAVNARNDAFQKELRDFLELMKGLTLGLAIAGAAFIVMRSPLPTAVLIIAPWACSALGVSAGMASALIYAHHRFDIKGQPLRVVIVRAFALITLLLTILGTFVVAGEVNRTPATPGKALANTATTCQSKGGGAAASERG